MKLELMNATYIPAQNATRIVYCPEGAKACDAMEKTIHHPADATAEDRAEEIEAFLNGSRQIQGVQRCAFYQLNL